MMNILRIFSILRLLQQLDGNRRHFVVGDQHGGSVFARLGAHDDAIITCCEVGVGFANEAE